jgi:hypothetical protein
MIVNKNKRKVSRKKEERKKEILTIYLCNLTAHGTIIVNVSLLINNVETYNIQRPLINVF